MYIWIQLIMRELKFLNKFLFKYRIKLIIGFFITVTARIFALIAPNLVGNSITLIENYILSSSIDLEVLKQRLSDMKENTKIPEVQV